MFHLSNRWRWRLFTAVLSVFFLFLYKSQAGELERMRESYVKQFEQCRRDEESVIVKLEVMFNHKQKAEQLLIEWKKKSIKEAGDLQDRVKRCEMEMGNVKTSLLRCETTVSSLNSSNTVLAPPRTDDVVKQKESEISQLKENLSQLQAVLASKTQELDRLIGEQRNITEELNICQRHIVLQGGGAPKGPYYVQNETVHFQRKHKVGEKLMFNRDEVHFEPAKLIPAKELMERLQKKKEEEGKHPDDRGEEDEYVNEKPNENEADYKEH